MSIFVIKIIACITMVLDHIKYAIPQTKVFFIQYLGRISFPLFAFLLVEGYSHTSNLKKYYKRLVIFAIISQIPFMLFRTLVGEWRMLNIMFTLLLGLMAITVFDKTKEKYYISISLVAIIIYFGKLLNVDYGWFGVATIFIFYLCRNHKLLRILSFSILALIKYYDRLFVNYTLSSLFSCIFTVVSVILLMFYNGKLGKKTKYVYYVFYPVHMLILYGLKVMICNINVKL